VKLLVALSSVALLVSACSDSDPTTPTDLVALVVAAAGVGSGTVTTTPAYINCTITDGAESGVCAAGVPRGETVTLQAQWEPGWDFGGWGDDCESLHVSIQCTIVAVQPVSVTASFIPANRNDVLFLAGPTNFAELRRRYGFSNHVAPLLPGIKVFEMAARADGSLIALVRRDNVGLSSIWTMKPDGTQLQQRIVGVDHNRMPSFSPDGQRLVFSSERSGAPDIWVADLDGQNALNLTPESPNAVTFDRSPVWSPDGSRIAWVNNRQGFSALWLMDADGGNQVRVGTGIEVEQDPTWSPDSRYLAFVRGYTDGTKDIVVHDLLTHEERRITLAGTERHTAWSPDGSRIAFSSDADGDYDLYSIAPDGTQLGRLTEDQIDDAHPVFLRASGPAPASVP
jgi:TolB protein